MTVPSALRSRWWLLPGAAILASAVCAVALFVFCPLRDADGTGRGLALAGFTLSNQGGEVAVSSPREDGGRRLLGSTRIDLWLDLASPRDRAFLSATHGDLETWLARGSVEVTVHPVASESDSLRGRWSWLTARALDRVARTDPAHAVAVAAALASAKLPSSRAAMPTAVDRVVAAVVGHGAPRIRGAWVVPAPGFVASTPDVTINGSRYSGALDDGADFRAAVARAGGWTPSA